MTEKAILKGGSTGESVEKLKNLLAQLGLTVTNTDELDADTEASVRLVQRALGLTPDGVVGEDLLRTLAVAAAHGPQDASAKNAVEPAVATASASSEASSKGQHVPPILVSTPGLDLSHIDPAATTVAHPHGSVVAPDFQLPDGLRDQIGQWVPPTLEGDLRRDPFLLNPDFEAGHVDGAIPGWRSTGDAFAGQPQFGDTVLADRVDPSIASLGGDYWAFPLPIGHQGDWWIGTFNPLEASDQAPTGTLTSHAFTVSQGVLSFLIGGTRTAQVRVELQIADEHLPEMQAADDLSERLAEPLRQSGTPVRTRPVVRDFPRDGAFLVVLEQTAPGGEFMQRIRWDVQPFLHYRARVRIVDHATAGHINCDDFQLSNP